MGKEKKVEPIQHAGQFGRGWGRLKGSIDYAMAKKKQNEEQFDEFKEYMERACKNVKAIY